MPISEDLKSVHAALAVVARSVSSDNAPLLRVACANILALAEQVEALETVPLAVTPLPLSVRPKGYAGMLQ